MEPVVSIHAYRRIKDDYTILKKKYETLKKVLAGQFVEAQDVQDALEAHIIEANSEELEIANDYLDLVFEQQGGII